MGYVKLLAITLGEYETLDKSKNIISLTDKLGRIKIKFKSAKSNSSKRSGYTYDFVLEKILLYKKNERYIATEVELIDAFENAKSTLDKIRCLLYMKELIIIFLGEGQGEEEIFNLLRVSLDLLNKGANEMNILLYFIFNFYKFIGLPITPPQTEYEQIFFSPEKGGFNGTIGLPVKKEVANQIEKFYSLNIIELQNYDNLYFNEIMKLLNIYALFHGNSNHLREFIQTLDKSNWGEK